MVIVLIAGTASVIPYPLNVVGVLVILDQDRAVIHAGLLYEPLVTTTFMSSIPLSANMLFTIVAKFDISYTIVSDRQVPLA